MPIAPTQPVYPPSPGKAVEAAWGDAVAEHVVQHFSDVADRNTKWTTPPLGSMCVTQTPTLAAWMYDGTTWLPFGGVLVGEMKIWPSTLVPPNWLICDGRTVSRTTYPSLFTILGSGGVWGVGDGSSTFNLPDMRGRTPVGVGTGIGLTARALAAKVGVESVTLSAADLPPHQHSIDHGHGPGTAVTDAQGSHMHTFGNNPTPGVTQGVLLAASPGGSYALGNGGAIVLYASATVQPQIIDPAGNHQHNLNTNVQPVVGGFSGAVGSGGAHGIMQPSIGLNYIIFAGAG